MAIEELKLSEQQIIRACMTAILEGDLIDDFEFQTRLGVEKHELASVLDSYPKIDDRGDESVESISINSCLNEICFGLGLQENVWSKWFDVSKEEVIEVFKKWRGLKGLEFPRIT